MRPLTLLAKSFDAHEEAGRGNLQGKASEVSADLLWFFVCFPSAVSFCVFFLYDFFVYFSNSWFWISFQNMFWCLIMFDNLFKDVWHKQSNNVNVHLWGFFRSVCFFGHLVICRSVDQPVVSASFESNLKQRNHRGHGVTPPDHTPRSYSFKKSWSQPNDSGSGFWL